MLVRARAGAESGSSSSTLERRRRCHPGASQRDWPSEPLHSTYIQTLTAAGRARLFGSCQAEVAIGTRAAEGADAGCARGTCAREQGRSAALRRLARRPLDGGPAHPPRPWWEAHSVYRPLMNCGCVTRSAESGAVHCDGPEIPGAWRLEGVVFPEWRFVRIEEVVGLRELESPTSSVSRKRSNQLSYRPVRGAAS